jgi:hypothetical protein
MSALKVRQIEAKLLEMFEPHLDLSDIGEQDAERRTKVLTRCLAAFAVYMETECTEVEAAQAVWDGSDDNGLDAVFHDVSDKRIIIVQSKWIKTGSGEPAAADLAVFANGVKDLVEDATDHFAARLQGRLVKIGQALSTPGVTVTIVLISTGASSISKHGTHNLDRIIHELNGGGYADEDPMASNVVYGLIEVYSRLASKTSGEAIILESNIFDWSHIAAPYSAYIGVIDGLQLKEWWTSHGKRLVAKNIRHSLGSTDVNDQIRMTALEEPANFWYFNNGITLIADDVAKAPKAAASRAAGIFQFKGASIVNGAQTVSTLGRIDNDESLGKVRVPIRVIMLRDAPSNFGAEVTRTNNLQNRVEGRDFAAQDPQQARIQQEMGIEDVEYQFLRSDTFFSSDRSCDLVEVTTALACASADPGLAVQLKTGIGRFFADINRAPYKTLFNPNLNGARAFNAVVVQRIIDSWIDRKKTEVARRSGYPWTVLIHGNRLLASAVFKLVGPELLSKPIRDFPSSVEGLEIEGKCEKIYKNMLSSLENEYPNKFLAVLFKNPSMSKDIFEKATA